MVIIIAGSVARYMVATSMLREGIQTTVSAQQMSMAQYVADAIDDKISVRQNLLEKMASELPESLLHQPRALEDWLEQRHNLAPLFSLGLVVIPVDGKGAVADYPPISGRLALDFNDRDWFREARDAGGFAIGKPTVGRAAYQPVLNMAAPIKDTQGKVTAVLMGVTALSLPGFLDTIQTHQIGNTGSFILFSPRDHIIVTATDPGLRLQPTPKTGTNRLHDQAMTGWRGTGISTNASGVETLSAYATVPGANWVVVASVPTTEIFATVTAVLGANVRSSIIAAVVLTVLLALLLNFLFRPLRDSARKMRAMATGDTPLERLSIVRQDEVGDMVESFNSLVEKLQETETKMAYVAHHDALTGLPNRRSFMTRMQQGLALASRRNSTLALMFIDLDGFKLINDVHGHKVGDHLLQQVAERLGEGVRQADIVGRFGGDEFIVLLTDCSDRTQITAIAEKLIARVSEPYTIRDLQLRIGASIGIALFPDDGPEVEPLIALADAAMYQAKRHGGNGYRFAVHST